MSDGGPRWSVGRGSLRSTKSRSSTTKSDESKGSRARGAPIETATEIEDEVDGSNQDLPQRAPVGAKRVRPTSVSRSRRSDGKTGESSEDDAGPRDSRSGQDKLPTTEESQGPQERGTAEWYSLTLGLIKGLVGVLMN